MVDLILLLFLSIASPLSMVLFIVHGRARAVLLFLLFGLYACLAAAYLNAGVLQGLQTTRFYATVNVAPVIEEALKALPVCLFAFLRKPRSEVLLESAASCGLGFAVLENAYVIAQNAGSVSLFTAIIRGIGSGMMHSLCTLGIAWGISLFLTHKKWFFPGVFALPSAAMTYHSLYNVLIQSKVYYLGVVLTVVTYALFLTAYLLKRVGARQMSRRS